ncbi:MAG: pyridoxal-dependent decarboxylase [Phycisphaerae bacterium]
MVNKCQINSETPETPFDPVELEQGLVRAASMLREFYEGLDSRRVSQGMPITETVHAFSGTLGEQGVGLAQALDDVRDIVLPRAMAIPHPLYMGLLNSSPLVGGIVAESIVGAMNNNAGSWEQGPPFVAAEQEVIRCFREMLKLSVESTGIVLPGGSYAALHALQLARDHQFPAWRTNGARSLSGDPRVYVSDASHFSAARAAIAVGVAAEDVVRVPTNGRGQMDASALSRILHADIQAGALPLAVVATIGTTGTGAIDPLPKLVDLCREHAIWLHVDACYGGAGALLDELAPHFEGIEMADSVAVDPHKWFFVPMVAGLLFTRHPGLELEVFDVDAPYIPAGELVDGFRRGLPTSRRSAGFAIWMALRAHGLRAVRVAVRSNVRLARRLEDRLRDEGFDVMEDGELSIACVRWEPPGMPEAELDDLQSRIAAALVRSGEAWFGTVRAVGKIWLRFALVSTFTRESHIDKFAKMLSSYAKMQCPVNARST